MRLHFLQTAVPLTKTYERLKTGELVKTPYPNVFHVTSMDEDVTNIQELHDVIAEHSKLNNCLLKGKIARPLVNESRAGSTNSADLTEWLCLDFDGIPISYLDHELNPPQQVKLTPDLILSAMGLGSVSYVLQWSASQNITSTTELRFHVFMLLNRPVAAAIIKQWLIHLNHTIPLLKNCRALTKTGTALTWGLDITCCQNDKLIYIAAPTLIGIKHPLGRTPRISVVHKQDPTFNFPPSTPTSVVNKEATQAHVVELREIAGLPARRYVTKFVKSVEVLAKPDVCQVTGIRAERGFVYLNINGGDSWGYYHPEDRADIIYNFKGEPNYITKELLPDYWDQLASQASRTSSAGITYLAFLDRRTGVYHRGTYDPSADALDLYPAKNETQIRHFAEQYGVPLGSYIPEWDLTFDPHDAVRVDTVNKTINTFQLTEYMRAPSKKVKNCPPTIFKIIHHALGSDIDCTTHFLNWFSFIVQNRTRTLTAWVMHGVEGTGKGILMNRILRPILGKNQTAFRRMEELNEPYNGYMKQCFLVFIDEVEAKALINERGVMAKLRSFITEATVPVRVMYSNSMEWENFTNWIFASNKPEPVIIPKEDRRFNVGKYQHHKLGMDDTELDLIPGELQAFHDYCLHFPVDHEAVATVLDNDDRSNMIAISESSIDTVANHVLDGDFEFLLDQLPSTAAYTGNAAATAKISDYKHALSSLLSRTDLTNGRCNISRDELRVIFDYVVGKIPESPNKFTSLLKHHRITTTKVRVDDKPVYGIKTTWKDYKKFAIYAKTHFPQPAAPAAKPAAKPATKPPAKPPTKPSKKATA